MTIPTIEEIGERFEARCKDDILGFEVNIYANYMTYKQIKSHAKDSLTEESWGKVPTLNRDDIIKEMREYITFAFDKAHGERGISASRSIEHFIAWTWLAGDIVFSTQIEEEYDQNYHGYGLPILIKICKHYGFDIPD